MNKPDDELTDFERYAKTITMTPEQCLAYRAKQDARSKEISDELDKRQREQDTLVQEMREQMKHEAPVSERIEMMKRGWRH